MPAGARRPTDGGGSSTSSGHGDAAPSPPKAARASTLYSVLNVAATATAEEITAAYRKLALKHHPDRPGGSHETFQELQRAYEVLNSKETRAKYDAVLRGRPALRNFKRPPPLESVLQPVYAMLADGNFYEFEAASSKLKCSIHYGDGIQFNNERGSFIGMAGDNFIYWIVNARGYATRLCEVGSSFALSSVRIMFRSNMGLQRKPLTRSSLPPSSSNRSAGSKRRDGAGPSNTPAGGSAGGGGGSPAAMPGGFDARRIKAALLNRERSRHVKKRLETFDQEEMEERNELEKDLWEQFCFLHTTLETAERCLLQGHIMPEELAHWMGYNSPVELNLRSAEARSLHSAGDLSPLQAATLWVDPLHSCDYSDGEEEDVLLRGGDASPPPSCSAAATLRASVAEMAHRRGERDDGSSVSPSPARSMSASSGDANDEGGDQACLNATITASSRAAATAPVTAATAAAPPPPRPSAPFHRSRSRGAMAAPEVPLTRHEPADLKQPLASSSPLPPSHLRPMHSSNSSFGNMLSGSSPVPHALNRSTSAPSPPAKAPRTLVTPAAPPALGLRPVVAASSGTLDSTKPGEMPTLKADVLSAPQLSTSLQLQPPATAVTDEEASAAQQFLSLIEAHCESRSSKPQVRYPWDADAQPHNHDSTARGNSVAFLHEAIPDMNLQASVSGSAPIAAPAAATAIPASSCSPVRPRQRTAAPLMPEVREVTAGPSASVVVSVISLLPQASATQSRSAISMSQDEVSKDASPAPRLHPYPQQPSLVRSSHDATERHTAGHSHLLSTSQVSDSAAGTASLPRTTVAAADAPPAAAAATAAAAEDAGTGARPTAAAGLYGSGGPASLSPLSPPTPLLTTSHGASQPLAAGGDAYSRLESGVAVAAQPPTARPVTSPTRRYDPEGEGAMAVSGDTKRASVAAFSPDSVPLTEAPPAEETSGQSGFGPTAAAASGTAGASVPSMSLPLGAALEQQQRVEASAAEQEAALEDVLGSTDDGLAKKRKQKGRSTPRYMHATVAHVRRFNASSVDPFNPSTSGASPRHESSRVHSDLTVEELLAEEKDFMSAFSKTKRAV